MDNLNDYPALASYFSQPELSQHGNRFWTEDGQHGLFANEDGTLTLLDCDGYPSNHNLEPSDAEYLTRMGRLGNWDYYATASN